jgi:hypothetical protein
MASDPSGIPAGNFFRLPVGVADWLIPAGADVRAPGGVRDESDRVHSSAQEARGALYRYLAYNEVPRSDVEMQDVSGHVDADVGTEDNSRAKEVNSGNVLHFDTCLFMLTNSISL